MAIELNKGDIIKFGRVRFRVNSISSSSQKPQTQEQNRIINSQIITSNNSVLSEDSSMLFDQHRLYDDFFKHCASRVGIDSKENILDQNNNETKSNKIENICRVCLSNEDKSECYSNRNGDNDMPKQAEQGKVGK